MKPEDEKKVLTPEELQQTQVINLKDLEEVVRIEKRTSKKPAIILGIIGIALLIGGSSFQIATSLKEKREAERKIEQRKEPTDIKTHLNCSQTKLNNSNGTDIIYSFSYDFVNDKLTKEVKILSAVPTPGTSNGKDVIKKYKESLKKYVNSTEGYTVSIDDSDDGFIMTTTIDYKKLDKSKLNSNQKEEMATRVNYEKDTYKNTILEDMNKDKFVCQ